MQQQKGLLIIPSDANEFDDSSSEEDDADSVGDLPPFSKLNIDNNEEEEGQEFSQQMF